MNNTKELTTVWITKYALTLGILKGQAALDLAVYLKRILAFDAPETVAEAPVPFPWPLNPAKEVRIKWEQLEQKEQPAKAREWTMAILESGSKYVFDLGRLDENELRQHCHATEVITIREILPNEASLLEEALDVIMDLRIEPCPFTESKADAFIKKYGPAPAPEPAFDWAKLWQELPSWIQWVAMDRDKKWVCFAAQPTNWEIKFWADQGDGIRYIIPPEFSPPAVADWTLSLVQRPTL